MITNLNDSDAVRGVAVGHQTAKQFPSEVLDLEGLRNRCMGNIDLMQRVLKMFQERIPEEVEAMEQALQRKDAEQVGAIAHRVKGSSASISAGGLMRAAAEIEEVSRAGRIADVPASIGHFRDEWEEYLNYSVTLLSAAGTA